MKKNSRTDAAQAWEGRRTNTAAPPPLKWDKWESLRCHQNWRAACGHHSIAAVCGIELEAVRRVQRHAKGWMSPTDVFHALRQLGRFASCQQGNFGKVPVPGINRIQWVGPWLLTGNPADAYHHTHWIGVAGDAVMDTSLISWAWRPLKGWADEVKLETGMDFFVTHRIKLQSNAEPSSEP